jgi:transcription elongation GreA/GreB family factor
MSRAFVKEVDDAPPMVPERTVSAAPNRVTPRGASLIAQAIATIERALVETADPACHPALRRDLRYWQSRRSTSQIAPLESAPARVGFGTSVTIQRGQMRQTLTIVGEDEADPASGMLAWTAPLARALEGAEAGDIVAFEAAGKVDPVTVLAVDAICPS